MSLPSTPQIRTAAQRAVHRWARDEVTVVRSAFAHGGHGFHGGAQWLPRKRLYQWPIVLKTGAMKRSVRAHAIGAGSHLVVSAAYASFHQRGTRTLPVRKIVDHTPEDDARLEREVKKDLEILIASRSL
jgi:phage gpG-like protein